MRVGSLFSGVGGFDLGLERAGMEVVAQCEMDPFRRQILRRHWPDTPQTADVSDVVGRKGKVDLLCGGFPCQDLSVAGRRAGLDGSRSGLFFEFARVADECLDPGGWLLIENVPGLLSSPGKGTSGRDFGVLLRTLVDLGFHDIAWRVLDSRYFGVPQRRRRVFVLARRARGSRAAEVLLEPESGGGHPEEGRKKRKKAAADAGSGAGGPRVVGTANDDDHLTIASAFDRRAGGADDNNAQANHIVAGTAGAVQPALTAGYGKNHGIQDGKNGPIGLVMGFSPDDHGVSSTLGSKGRDGGGSGNDRDGAMVVTREVAAPLTKGSAAGEGVSVPGRRKEDDENIVGVMGAVAHTLTSEGMDASEDGSGRGTPVVARSIAGKWRAEEDVDTIVAGFNWQTGGSAARVQFEEGETPTLQTQQTPAVFVSENQRSEVLETDYAHQLTTGGGKPGQGYPAARIGEGDEQFVRRLTPTECERLQGFPDGWTLPDGPSLRHAPSWYEIPRADGGQVVVLGDEVSPTLREHVRNNSNPATEASMHVHGVVDERVALMWGRSSPREPRPDGRRYAAMGDAVTVPVIHWIGRRIMEHGA